MKTTTIQAGFCLLIFFIMIAGCKKDLEDVNPSFSESEIQSMDQIAVSPEFDWKTTRDVSLRFTCKTISYIIIQSKTGIIYQKAMLSPGIPYLSKISIPTYEVELNLIFNGNEFPVKIKDSEIIYDF